jgi:hypothetical protein
MRTPARPLLPALLFTGAAAAAPAPAPLRFERAPRALPAPGAPFAAAAPLQPCPEPLGAACAGPGLPEGAAVVITEARMADGAPWAQVRAEAGGPPVGWVPLGALSAAALTADLDGDGAPERVLARFTEAAHVELLVWGASGPPQRLDLGLRQDIEGPQDAAELTLLPAAVAGLPLLRVRWAARELCGSGDAYAYASYTGAPPTLRAALAHPGSGADAPIFWETTVTFDPKARTAAVRQRAGEALDGGGEQINSDVTKRYALRDGVFVERGR